jgi:hypothetical protein
MQRYTRKFAISNTVLGIGQTAPPIPGLDLGNDLALIVFFETDCPTCRLAVPYLNKLALGARVIGISQDDQAATNQFTQQLATVFPSLRSDLLSLAVSARSRRPRPAFAFRF